RCARLHAVILRPTGLAAKGDRVSSAPLLLNEGAMGRKTPLYDSHTRLGAKIVDFGGWDMPLHYGSQIEEHHAVRRAAGMFDVSHMGSVDLRGSGAANFLRHLLANDVARLRIKG